MAQSLDGIYLSASLPLPLILPVVAECDKSDSWDYGERPGSSGTKAGCLL